MKRIARIINNLMIELSIKPYKTVTLDTGLIVNHYMNGKLIAKNRDKKR